MRLKTRTIAGGLVVIGAVIGTLMSGLLPGFGSGSGVGVQASASGDDDTSPDTPNEPQPEPAPVEESPATSPADTPPPEVLEVRIDKHGYMVPDSGADGFRKVDLDDVVKLAEATTGNDDGIRVRVVRHRAARVSAWLTLYDSLKKAGVSADSILMPKSLIE